MKHNWEYKKLGDVCTVVGGSTPKTNIPEYWGGENYWVTPAELTGDKYIESTERTITDEAVAKTNLTLLPVGTVLLSSRAPIGKVCITRSPMYCNQGFKNIVCSKCLLNEYVYWWLKGKTDYLNSLGVGATFKEISKRTVEQIVIPVPPLEEQSRIVAELDLLTGIIDKQNAQLKELDNLAQAIFYDMFGDPIENPKGWVVKMLGDIVANEKYALKAGPFGSALKKEFYKESGYKIYGQEQVIANDVCVGNYYVDESKYQELKSCAVKEDDVLISLVGTFGKVLVIPKWYEPGIINPRLIKITFDKAVVNTVYFRSYFSSSSTQQKLKEMTHGQTMGVLNLGILKQMCIPVPPLALQQSFAEKIQSIEKQKETIRASIADTQKLLDYTMDKYFG